MTAPTDQEIAKLRRLLEAATPGPWFVHDFADPRVSERPGPQDIMISCSWPDTITIAFMGNGLTGALSEARTNATLFVAMRNTLTGLLDAYEARGRAIERLRADEAAPIIADLLTSVLQGAGYRRDDIVRVLRGGGYEHLLIWEREAVDWLWEYLRANPDHPPINLRAAEFVKAARRADETKGGA